MTKSIQIQGARTHNLADIDVTIPRDQLVVVTGLSGSGKSSLAFDTLYAEGQRRYVESLSAYARQFLSLMEKPDVDEVSGLSPAISIEQKAASHNPRSTVGTVTEIYDYLRVFFARVGVAYCPDHQVALSAQTITQMVDATLAMDDSAKLMLLAPVVKQQKGTHHKLLQKFYQSGFLRAQIDGQIYLLESPPTLTRHQKHDIDVIVDRLKPQSKNRQRLAESFETALDLSAGLVKVVDLTSQEQTVFSNQHACPYCHYSLKELSPRLFSFNSPVGACQTCNGLGSQSVFDLDKIIPDPTKSIAQGAIRGWDARNAYYYGQLQALAAADLIDLNTPFEQLTQVQKNAVLYGTQTSIKMELTGFRGRKQVRNQPFEGVLPHYERRYRDSDSPVIRDELAKLMSHLPCPDCQQSRLSQAARCVQVNQINMPTLCDWPIEQTVAWFDQLVLSEQSQHIAQRLVREIQTRLQFLVDVGLGYLTLSRQADTLSGGESQRIRLASQIGAGLVGVMYVLDEPSIGLHQRDNQRLLDSLHHLRDLGNTVIVVEHDEDTIRQADHVIDMGPKAGVHGGQVVAQGTPEQIAQSNTLTGGYLSGRYQIDIPTERQKPQQWLTIQGACGNNLQSVDFHLPIGVMTCVTGVSGSGKSTLINQTLYPLAAQRLNRATEVKPADFKSVQGFEYLDKVVNIDQSPIGRTPRSNPATYTGVFTPIRELFAGTEQARARGYNAGRFSFNVKGGRCEACRGDGVIKVEMHFLPDVYVTCEQCQGQRYNAETLQVHYKGKTIHQVLDMTIEQACEFFEPIPSIARRLKTLIDVGLSYLKLGQNATTLSGGEAQRVKLARELAKTATGQTLYILDEPTTGLHFDDIRMLLNVLTTLRNQNNTIVVIEHNLDVIKVADWVVDLGPEGGQAGGKIIATGTPEHLSEQEQSATGHFLKRMLQR